MFRSNTLHEGNIIINITSCNSVGKQHETKLLADSTKRNFMLACGVAAVRRDHLWPSIIDVFNHLYIHTQTEKRNKTNLKNDIVS